MSHEVETMAYANAVPWHGLGNKVDPSVSIDEMLVAAGLNWTVEKKPCFTEINGEKVYINREALVRDTDNSILTITGEKWKPLQNKNMLEFFREYTETGGATLETAGSLRNGRIVWGLASVNKSFILNGRDEVKAYILLTSPHEVGNAIKARRTSVRVVCANTLAMAENADEENYRQSHAYEFDVSKAKEMVARAIEGLGQMELEAQALQQLKLSRFDTVRLLAKFFQPVEVEIAKRELGTQVEAIKREANEKAINALINDPATWSQSMNTVDWAIKKAPGATPGNGWGFLNGVTYYADHLAGRDPSTRLYNSWLGSTGNTKQAVKTELLEMADAA